jgi:predicted Zn-dependent protease
MMLAKKSERPALPWSFTVVEDAAVNAFALPGGPVFVTRGILAHMNSEAQLVSVLGHEIGHITAKHSVSQISRSQLAQIGLVAAVLVKPELAQFGDIAGQGLGLLFLKFGRDDEIQADGLGFRYMTANGYDPREMAEMFRTLERLGAGSKGRVPEWMSTHPDPGNRVQQTMNRIAQTPGLPQNLKAEREAFVRRLDGMVYGQNPRHGFFRETTFLHPDMRFQFTFPAGWQAQNQPSQVVGMPQAQDAVVVLTAAGNTAPAQALGEFLGAQGMQNRGASNAAINGLPAASAAFSATTQEGTLAGWVAFITIDGGMTIRLLGYTTADRINAYDGDFRAVVSSFRRLTDAAALNVQPSRIKLVRVPTATPVEQFFAKYPSTIPVAEFALINGVDVRGTFPAGTLVKQVVDR